MQAKRRLDKQNEGVFLYLLSLTIIFILFELSFFLITNEAYFFQYNYISHHLAIPAVSIIALFRFIVAELSIHLVFCIFVWMITLLITTLFSLTSYQQFRFAIYSWISGILTALVANQYLYPQSKWTDLSIVVFFHPLLTKSVLIILCSINSVILTLSLISLFKIGIKKITRGWICFIISVGAGLFYYYAIKPHHVFISAANKARPNIILVGVDSLRPDFLSYFGHERKTPFIDNFLSQSAVFTQAVTPIARTFPSWMSILSGLYPRENGIRYNLTKQTSFSNDSLPAILTRAGYRTIYATDEVRFSNILRQNGFDHVVTPPMGVNDFLFGALGDFPLSNILVNSKLGRWLFPYSYANRGAYFVYDPNTFLRMVEPILKTKSDQPLFLAIHFCLPHTPYVWSESQATINTTPLAKYASSVTRVDQQLKQFFMMLNQYHLLDHAIVVLLSDHGEGLALPGDRITEPALFRGKTNKAHQIPKFYTAILENEAVNVSVGHGTDVLGLSQYHTLLAFKLYGLGKQERATINTASSLLDIKPTILAYLQLQAKRASGVSLFPVIQLGNKHTLPLRHLFLESDFSPASILTAYPDIQRVMMENITYFQIDPKTSYLFTKDSLGQMIVKSKQYADLYGNWILALYPQGRDIRVPILVNLATGEWTNDLHSALAKQSPAFKMLSALKTFYGEELAEVVL